VYQVAASTAMIGVQVRPETLFLHPPEVFDQLPEAVVQFHAVAEAGIETFVVTALVV
jgi:hypothetical protein